VKRIVLCFDGTWRRPADESLSPDQQVETNVARFYRSVHDVGSDGVGQAKWYDEGVGTNWYDRFVGGTIGAGLEFNILEGYTQLARHFQPGDEVFILGFSRGAYTARSLAGLIRNCGLVKPSLAVAKAPIAYGIYRTRDDGPDSRTAALFRRMFSQEIPIKFMGVWDTVGALGIPSSVLEGFNSQFYEFHDTRLSSIVQHAYHAVALDEHREAYKACLWEPGEEPRQRLEQRWFAGSHSDVGGGHPDRRLSDITLNWMQEKAAACGLSLTKTSVSADNCCGPIVDSFQHFLRGLYAKNHRRHVRPVLTAKFGREVIDPSVEQRQKQDATYTPSNAGLRGTGAGAA